jgi:hypothetical protein
MPRSPLPSYTTRRLDAETWPAFARLVEAHNGAWGGCWRRGAGIASAALAGALAEIARPGGGTVESHPDDTDGHKTSASFLHNGTVAMFERQGFERTRRIGKTRSVVRRVVG